MKTKVFFLLALTLALAVSSALAVSPYELDGQFLAYVQQIAESRINWQRTMEDDGTFVTITETGMVNGSKCEFTVIGYRDRAYQLCVTVPFSGLIMDEGMFPDALVIYNETLHLAMNQLPENSEPYGIFSSYDIHYAVQNGCSYIGNSLNDGWQWTRKEVGYLAIRKWDSGKLYVVEAHRLDTGNLWFNCQF